MADKSNSDVLGQKNLNITVTAETAGQRLDQCLVKLFPDYSRVFLQNLISSGNILVNGEPKKNSYSPRSGDKLIVSFPPPTPSGIEPAEIPLDILYEDKDMIVINKKAGIVVHPAYGHQQDTLVNALMHYNPGLSTIGGVMRPGIVHRLDKDTSGVMIIAKNDQAHNKIADQFKNRSVEKDYLCFVRGIPSKTHGEIITCIGRDPHNRKKFAVLSENGKEAVSVFEVINTYPFCSLIKVQIKTGRTHQVRLHMTHIGCPVVGDKTYGRSWNPPKAPKELTDFLKHLERVMLHSSRIALTHPSNNERKTFYAPQPAEFTEIENILRRI
jgi:23S rRNA pseudouridine1911/1915/1917 synthase